MNKRIFKIEFVDTRADEKFYERVGYFYNVDDAIERLEKEGRIDNPKFCEIENYMGEERVVYASMTEYGGHEEYSFSVYIYELDPREAIHYDLDAN